MHPFVRYRLATDAWRDAKAAKNHEALQGAARARRNALAAWHDQGTPARHIARRTGVSVRRVEQMIDQTRAEASPQQPHDPQETS